MLVGVVAGRTKAAAAQAPTAAAATATVITAIDASSLWHSVVAMSAVMLTPWPCCYVASPSVVA